MVLEGLAFTAEILGELPPFQKPNRLDLGSQPVRKGGGFLGSGSQRIREIGLETPRLAAYGGNFRFRTFARLVKNNNIQ